MGQGASAVVDTVRIVTVTLTDDCEPLHPQYYLNQKGRAETHLQIIRDGSETLDFQRCFHGFRQLRVPARVCADPFERYQEHLMEQGLCGRALGDREGWLRLHAQACEERDNRKWLEERERTGRMFYAKNWISLVLLLPDAPHDQIHARCKPRRSLSHRITVFLISTTTGLHVRMRPCPGI